MTQRLLLAGLCALLTIGAAACGSKGQDCVALGGSCQPNGVCPTGTAQPTAAQIIAQNPNDDNTNTDVYSCPGTSSGATDESSQVCCLPSDAGAAAE